MDSRNLLASLTSDDDSLAGKPITTTLAAVLLSFAGFQGWLFLFLIGAIFKACQRVRAFGSIVDSFWITVDFQEGNRSLGKCLPAVVQTSPDSYLT